MSDQLTLIVADIVRRIPDLAKDSPVNNERVLTGLLEPLVFGGANPNATVRRLLEPGEPLKARLESTAAGSALNDPSFVLGLVIAPLLSIQSAPAEGATEAEVETYRQACHQAFRIARARALEFLRDQKMNLIAARRA